MVQCLDEREIPASTVLLLAMPPIAMTQPLFISSTCWGAETDRSVNSTNFALSVNSQFLLPYLGEG